MCFRSEHTQWGSQCASHYIKQSKTSYRIFGNVSSFLLCHPDRPLLWGCGGGHPLHWLSAVTESDSDQSGSQIHWPPWNIPFEALFKWNMCFNHLKSEPFKLKHLPISTLSPLASLNTRCWYNWSKSLCGADSVWEHFVCRPIWLPSAIFQIKFKVKSY